MNFLKNLKKQDKFQKVLSEFTDLNLKKNISKSLSNKNEMDKIDLKTLKKGLLTPMNDLLTRKSKNIRPFLTLATSELLNIKEREDDLILKIAGLTEIIHNNTLIIDDIQDKSKIRRGEICTYLKYGIDTSLNSSNFFSFYLPTRFIEIVKTENKLQEYEILNCYLDCIKDL